MIIDARQITDSEIRGSIAIIGGGAAGITLALELGKQFKDVLLLESGGLDLEPDTQKLYDGNVIGHDTAALETARLRFLGGTTNHWEGKCAPLDAIDFERLPGRPYSGWPFTLDELIPFYKRAYGYCEIGPFRTTSAIVDRAQAAVKQMAESPDFVATEFRYSPPTRFGERYRADLRAADNIKVCLHANVVDIAVADGGREVTSVAVQTLSGVKFQVKAAAFILCCGGIENPRILLNCNRVFSNGIGNQNDLVGRFFMDHYEVYGASIVPGHENFDYEPLAYHYEGATRASVALMNPPDVVRREGRAGCSVIMDLEFNVSEQLQKAQKSAAYRAFQQLARNARMGGVGHALATQGCTALGDLGSIATILSDRAMAALGHKAGLKSITLRLEGEQLPNPDSRVELIDGVDALGMRKCGLDWKVPADDRNNLYQTALTLAKAVGATGFGRMVMPMKSVDDDSTIGTSFHHMGTTRMHDDPKQGVVDRNCAIHGLANFYVAGSSVFPTCGRVNPTLSIVTLAIRLADYLKTKVTA